MINEVHKLNLSDQSVGGASESSNNLEKTSSLACVNGGGVFEVLKLPSSYEINRVGETQPDYLLFES
jgi:hypothetical protein